MPIYMDIHLVPGVNAEAVAQAHKLDMLIQEHHGCRCMTYWIDEERENVFCLIEAPGKQDIEAMHLQAHGLNPNRIIEVDTAMVKSILGRVHDPDEFVLTESGLKVFVDPSYRIIMICHMADKILLKQTLGTDEAVRLTNLSTTIISNEIRLYGGREVEHDSTAFIASFTSAKDAVECATKMVTEISKLECSGNLQFKVVINGGEPIEKSNDFFGDAFRFGNYMQFIAENGKVTVSSCIKERIAKDNLLMNNRYINLLNEKYEQVIDLLFGTLEENFDDAEFDIDGYCKATMMSKSQLYRKTMEIAGLSPNALIKDFRLTKAKDLMKRRKFNISQITFDSGFTSPSYFTKCFKKKYGIVPMEYLEQV